MGAVTEAVLSGSFHRNVTLGLATTPPLTAPITRPRTCTVWTSVRKISMPPTSSPGRYLHRHRVGHLLHLREECHRVAQLGQGIAERIGARLFLGAGRTGRRLIQSRDVISARFQAMHAILAAIVGARAGGRGIAVTPAIVIGAIQLNGDVDGWLGVVEFHFAADYSRGVMRKSNEPMVWPELTEKIGGILYSPMWPAESGR